MQQELDLGLPAQPPATTHIFELRGEQIVVDNTAISPPAGMSATHFKQLVIGAYAANLIDKNLNPDNIARRSGLSEETVRYGLTTPEVRDALSMRGVVYNQSPALTPKQDLFLLIFGDPHDGLTFSQKLKKAGVTNTQYQAWLRNPYFREHINTLAEQLHTSNAEAIIQLQRKAGEGDLSAIKYLFEMNGRYNPKQQQAVDIVVILSKVLESLSRHVTDKAALEAVAQDIRQIAMDAKLIKDRDV